MILFILLVPQMESRLARGHQTGHRSHLSPVIETLAAPGLDYRSSVVLADLQEPELASRSLEVAAFTQLRAKKLLNLSSSVPILAPVRVVSTKAPERPRGPPQEICDSNTSRKFTLSFEAHISIWLRSVLFKSGLLFALFANVVLKL